jgi:hypothetical protein
MDRSLWPMPDTQVGPFLSGRADTWIDFDGVKFRAVSGVCASSIERIAWIMDLVSNI